LSVWEREKKAVLEAGLTMWRKGLVVGTSGNVSMRLPAEGQDLMAVTPNKRYYDLLGMEDIIVTTFSGDTIEGELVPSSEVLLHAAIYEARPEVNAVVHTHSPFASAAAVAGVSIPPLLDDQVTFLGGEITVAPYALPGTEELGQNAARALGNRQAVMLANHGAVGVGRGIREALTACELLEKTAQVFFWARLLGAPRELPPDALRAGKAFFQMSAPAPE